MSIERIPDHRAAVRPEWIDYNGHMNEAFYVLVFGQATDELMILTGLDEPYRESSGCSLYTAEAHVRYLREVSEGTELTVRTKVLGVDAKKVRLVLEMFAGGRTRRRRHNRTPDDPRRSEGGPRSAVPRFRTRVLRLADERGARVGGAFHQAPCPGREAPGPPVRSHRRALVDGRGAPAHNAVMILHTSPAHGRLCVPWRRGCERSGR